MNIPAQSQHPATSCELSSLVEGNHRLARILRASPATLPQAEELPDDGLLMCGILGGKDVGKSTLVNALAQTLVSRDDQEIGPGTRRPSAFAHEDDLTLVAKRFRCAGASIEHDFVGHQHQDLRGVVLVDLPDFDSEFIDHLDIVRRIAPLLDQVFWVMTPRKVGDREWCSVMSSVVKDLPNVKFILNKVDELLADYGAPCSKDAPATPAVFWSDLQDWFFKIVQGIGIAPHREQLFLVSAAYPTKSRLLARVANLWGDQNWEKYNGERSSIETLAALAEQEMLRLRGEVLAPIAQRDLAGVKRANRCALGQEMQRRIEKHFDLHHVESLLQAAAGSEDDAPIAESEIDEAYCLIAADRLARRLPAESELAAEVMRRDIDRWPMLRAAYWPMGGLARFLGARWTAGLTPTADSEDPFLVAGLGLTVRLDAARAHYLARHAGVLEQLCLTDRIPEAAALQQGVRAAADRLSLDLQQRVIAETLQRRSGTSVGGGVALWLLLAWIFIGHTTLATIVGHDGAIHLNWSTLLQASLAATRPSHLLTGSALFAIGLLVIMARMYAMRIRRVGRLLSREFSPTGDGQEASAWSTSVIGVFQAEGTMKIAAAARGALQELRLTRRLLQATRQE